MTRRHTRRRCWPVQPATHQPAHIPTPLVYPDQLWRIGVLIDGAADTITNRGLADPCPATTGTHGACPPDGPCCVMCAIVTARETYAASGAPAIRGLPPAALAEAVGAAQTFAQRDGLDTPTGDQAATIETLRARARLLFRAALPLGRHLRVIDHLVAEPHRRPSGGTVPA